MYRDATNVEPEMYDYTSNNWSHWNSNEKLEEKFGNCTKKTFDRFTTKDSYTWNITHKTESRSTRKNRHVTRNIHTTTTTTIIIIIIMIITNYFIRIHTKNIIENTLYY